MKYNKSKRFKALQVQSYYSDSDQRAFTQVIYSPLYNSDYWRDLCMGVKRTKEREA